MKETKNASILWTLKFLALSSVFFVFFWALYSATPRQANAQTADVMIPSSFLFQINLKFGDSVDPDIKYLQYILDQDTRTAVAISGPGSTNELTSYLGMKTKDAVTRFQELYSQEILTPIGLTSGNGYVGPRTIAKLNSLIHKDRLVKTSTTTTTATTAVSSVASSNESPSSKGVIPQSSAFMPVSSDNVLLYGLSHLKAKPGDLIDAVGFGFDPDTVIHIGPLFSMPANPKSDTKLSFQVPNIFSDTYEVWISNKRGTSVNISPIELTVGSITDVRPNILSVTPRTAGFNDTISVSLDKLDLSGNVIYSNLGTIRGVSSSDGHSLTFKVSDLPNVREFFQNKAIRNFVVTFGIGTSETRSINYGYFTISI